VSDEINSGSFHVTIDVLLETARIDEVPGLGK
jgi:hypothetical protein